MPLSVRAQPRCPGTPDLSADFFDIIADPFPMAGKLTARSVESLAKKKGRYLDGHGLFLRVLDPGRRVYWVIGLRPTAGSARRASAPILR